jgi:mannose-1-phosphate guanylyltransferase
MSAAFVCIMAGGSGERFWPMSRRQKPKHLLRLFSDETLVAETVRRAEKAVPRDNIFILTNEAQLAATREAVPFLPAEQIIAEPAKRDTASAAALATALARARDPEAVVALLPADSLIKDTEAFAAQLKSAFVWAAAHGDLLTFSIPPRFASTGFGYLELGDALEEGFRQVQRFVEKPDAATAQKYFDSGRYGWNAGMFVWKAEVFLKEAQRLAPELASFVADFPRGSFNAFLQERFPVLPKISVDYAIMEKAGSVVAVPAAFDWDDVGTWTALPAHLSRDEAGNTVRGSVAVVAAKNNIVVSNGRLIALCGVSDLVVVETADAILVCHRDAVQDVKKLQPNLPADLL